MGGFNKYKYYKGKKILFSITGTEVVTGASDRIQNNSSCMKFALSSNTAVNESIDNIFLLHLYPNNNHSRVVRWDNKQYIYNASFDLREYTGLTISKNVNRGVDGNDKTNPINGSNYYTNRLYLTDEDRNSITKITFECATSIFISNIYFADYFPNLREIEQLYPSRVNGIISFGDGVFCQSLAEFVPNLEKLVVRSGTGSNDTWNDLPLLTSLKYFRSHYAPSRADFNIFTHLPPNLYYFRIYFIREMTMELSEYYTGNRVGLYLEAQNGISTHKLTYTGKAIFPSVISEDANYPIDYIYHSTSNINQKLTPTEVSKFLMDFANQVTAVTTSQKRIRLTGMVADELYEDLSQSLFTTYASALAHITGTLGVTVQFT